ncbi:unnamed protein product [Clonostachys byssicola]|uniref:Uncharacterized protein n=1 Tax=Clonostachys byssicola TaxID=160290 RepID=A0A9N9XW66_9HYPO|nr:unnamed protein product [Clonostachys byssicola]
MATENAAKDGRSTDRYHNNDTGPFASDSHTLVLGGPGQQKIRLDMSDRDMMLCASVDESTVRLLHLRNVREDTADKAKSVVEQLLDELKSLDESTKKPLDREGYIELEHAVDETHEDVRKFICAEAEKRGLDFEWGGSGYSRPMLRSLNEQTYFTLRWRKGGTWETGGGTRVVPA